MKFLSKRIEYSKHPEDGAVYRSFDTSSISSYSETIRKLSYEYSKENLDLPQLNLGLIVSGNSGEPLYYKILEGSLSDPLALRQMLADTSNLGTTKVNLVMDRAFSTPTLLDQPYKQNRGFICGSETNLNYCKAVISSFAHTLRTGGLEDNKFFYCDLIPKELRETLKALNIDEPPRFNDMELLYSQDDLRAK